MCNNPQFIFINSSISLSYEKKIENFNNIYFIPNWGSNIIAQSISDSLNGDISDLQTWNFFGIADKIKKTSQSYEINSLHAYRYLKNDSLYISTNIFPNVFYLFPARPDTLIYTKVKNTGLAVSYILTDSGSVNVIWEDSLNGKIQLFGIGASVITGVKDNRNTMTYHLFQNYPNPFNPSTTIKYQIPKESNVTIKIYDVLGREVSTLLNTEQKVGEHEVEWNANGFASGIYFYQIKAKNFIDTKKMLLIK